MEGAAVAGRGGGAGCEHSSGSGRCVRAPSPPRSDTPAWPRPAPEPRPHFHTVLRPGGRRGGSAAPPGRFPSPSIGAQGARPRWPEGGCQPAEGRDSLTPISLQSSKPPALFAVSYNLTQCHPVSRVSADSPYSLKYLDTGLPESVLGNSGSYSHQPKAAYGASLPLHVGGASVDGEGVIPHTSDTQDNLVKRATPASLLTSAHPLHLSLFHPVQAL